MPIEIVPRQAGPRNFSARPNYPQEKQGIDSLLDQGSSVYDIIDSAQDEGPAADAGDTSSPNFGQGMSVPQMYEILEPLARMVAEQTGEPLQAILQEMVTDPTAIGRAKSMLGMDPTTPFPNNIREPMPSEDLMSSRDMVKQLQEQLYSVPLSQQFMDPRTLNRVTDQELSRMLRDLPLSQQFMDPNTLSSDEMLNLQKQSYENIGPPSTVPMNPVARPTMSERLLSQMSLRDE